MKYSPLFLTLSLALIASCGKGGGGGSSSGPKLQEQQAEGQYRAIIRPMNNHLSGYLPSGVAEIKIDGETVKVKTLLDDDARVVHVQSIHEGTRCPTMGDDSNRDGVVDANEAIAASGAPLIPLDADINSAEDGANVYPVGTGFTYMETAELARLENDVKARTNQNLNLGGRVIIIHGVSGSTRLPPTIATKSIRTPQESVPIACGVIKRID